MDGFETLGLYNRVNIAKVYRYSDRKRGKKLIWEKNAIKWKGYKKRKQRFFVSVFVISLYHQAKYKPWISLGLKVRYKFKSSKSIRKSRCIFYGLSNKCLIKIYKCNIFQMS